MASDPILELKLCLLHELLTTESARETLFTSQYKYMLEEVYEGKSLRNHVEDLISIGDDLSREYIALLTKIRDFLDLGSHK
jgi:hypothetical protein